MYTPQVGQFLSRDPLPQDGQPDLLYDNNWFGRQLDLMRNRYGYGNSNPLTRLDPSGLAPQEIDDSCASYCLAYVLGLEGLAAAGGAAGVGALAQVFNKTALKPRGGIAGGGPSGLFSSRTRSMLGKPLGKALGRASIKSAAGACAVAFTAAEYLACYIACKGSLGPVDTSAPSEPSTRSPDDLTANLSGNIAPPGSFAPSGSILGP